MVVEKTHKVAEYTKRRRDEGTECPLLKNKQTVIYLFQKLSTEANEPSLFFKADICCVVDWFIMFYLLLGGAATQING